ncbi:MAG: PEP-CTERM sorting domain-containing protein [Moorea sp. SIO1G6]|uniref:PEP-CTERM sorting domain-containing protein n=1 Tax=Moorena sp. SIO1G6 TaxID=2607840 RepID=UPI0013C1D37F|nr:PEP-CTERM sorting domain-containing protein [Moorena sp. SIO1G6]NET64761.1 PEP-CTERM sorting domain-containing protein [Moorena sp. SIO1G6]
MINFYKQLGVVTTAIALTCATVGVLPAAAFQIIKHEFSGELELLSSRFGLPSIFILDESSGTLEPFSQTKDYEGFVEYTTEGELLSWSLDVEDSSRLGSDTLEPLPFPVTLDPRTFVPTVGSDLTFEILPTTLPIIPRTFVTTFRATPDNWTLDVDFGRFMDLGGQTLTWNRESGIRFSRDSAFFPPTIYVDLNPNFKETITNLPSNWVDVDPNPNFKETITNIPSNWLDSASVPEPASGLALYWVDPTSVPEPASGLALLGVSALGAGSVLKRRDK